MNTRKMRMAALVLAAGLSGTAQAALHDRGGGLIYDDVLNITWLQNANYGAGSIYDGGSDPTDGTMTWGNAAAWASSLSYYDSVRNVTYDDWRLPTTTPINGTSFDTTHTTDGSTDVGYNITSPNSELAYMFYVNLGNPGYFTPAGVVSGCISGSYDPTNNCLDNVGPFLIPADGYVFWSGTTYGADNVWEFDFGMGLQTTESAQRRLFNRLCMGST